MRNIEIIQKEIDTIESILAKIDAMKRLPRGFTVGDLSKVTQLVNSYLSSLKANVGEVDGGND